MMENIDKPKKTKKQIEKQQLIAVIIAAALFVSFFAGMMLFDKYWHWNVEKQHYERQF